MDSNFQFLELGQAFFTPLRSLELQTLCQFTTESSETRSRVGWRDGWNGAVAAGWSCTDLGVSLLAARLS